MFNDNNTLQISSREHSYNLSLKSQNIFKICDANSAYVAEISSLGFLTEKM